MSAYVSARPIRKRISRALFYVLLAVILFYIAFPFYWVLRSALTPDTDILRTPISYLPVNPTLKNFQLIFQNNTFVHALWNSTIVAGTVTILSLLIGSLAAYALGRFKFLGRNLMLYIILGMTTFPQVAILSALFKMVVTYGLWNHLSSLIVTYMIFTLPFTVWVLTSFFRAMPRELEEAAYVDGASPFQTYYRIMLPLVAPGLVTTGLLAFIAAWNEFLFAASFIQTTSSYTVPLSIFNFEPNNLVVGTYAPPWGQIMAAVLVVTVPLIALVLIFQRRIVAGLTAGAVKG